MPIVNGTTAAWSSDTNKTLNTHRATGMPEVGDNSSALPVVSTNISVYANGMRVGFIQSMAVSESRTNTPVNELGTEGVVQIVPGNTTGGSITINRFAVYNAMLANALGLTPTGLFTPINDQTYGSASTKNSYNTYGNPFKTLKDQRVPIEIQTKTIMPDSQMSYYIETYIDCWLTQYGKQFQSSAATVAENATIKYSDVYSSAATE